MKINGQFIKYVSQNILGMVGVSCYILADTFFISVAAGADGITVLNLALPIYGIIFAIGSMIAMGSATRFAILRARGEVASDDYLFNGFFWICLCSVPFVLLGIFRPEWVIGIMGGDAQIVSLGRDYFHIFVSFAPAFMLNYLFQAFVRNDGEPTRAMIATLSGSIFNIIFDYIFMFPLGMGMTGAALATSVSPILGIVISCTHFFNSKNTLRFVLRVPSFRKLVQSCQLGISAFVAEISSAVTTAVFNFLILAIVGKIGVAAYGVIANFALVAVAVFNGTAQGMQPLISTYYGNGDMKTVNKVFRMGIVTALGIAIALIGIAFGATDELVAIFNSEGSVELAGYAHKGFRIYFAGYIFAGFNIVATGYFGAVAKAREAFVASILRGFLAIIICAVIMASLLGLNGVWGSFAVAEAITTVVILFFIFRGRKSVIK